MNYYISLNYMHDDDKMNDCIYFDKEWSRCFEKSHQCHIEQKQCINCQYKETWNFGENFRKRRKESKI